MHGSRMPIRSVVSLRRDLIQSTNPDVRVFASVCTSDYLIVSSMGGGVNAHMMKPSDTQTWWGREVDVNQLKNSIPFAALKTSPDADPFNPLSDTDGE